MTTDAKLESAARALLGGRSILLVERAPMELARWQPLLERIGMQVRIACGQSEAMTLLSERAGERLDFAIVADPLPDGSSLTLVERLGALQPAPELVMVSHLRSDAQVLASWKARVALLPEPDSADALISMLQELQRRRPTFTSAPPPPQPLVLVVEDSPAATGLIRETLEGEYRIETASDGYIGFRMAMQLIPDVIITDLNMPRLDGSQLLRLLRSRPDLQHIPVVLLTSHGDESLRMRVLSEGAQDFLVKPFSAHELRARIGNLAAIARSRALLRSEISGDDRRLDAIVGQLMLQKRHAVFLAEASKLLGSSLEYHATIKQAMRLYVAHVADAVQLDLANDHDSRQLTSLALACADPNLERALTELRQELPPALGQPHPLVRAAESGETTRLEQEPGLLRSLNLHSGMSAPLVARDRIIGTLTAWSTIATRPFGPLEQTLTESLARRIALTIDHARLYRDATQAVAARDEFLSVASHELKTPLNPLQLQVGSLLRRADQIIVPEHREKVKGQLDSVHRQTEKLTRLVNDLLDLSRISSGRIELDLQWLDLSDVVREVVKLFEERDEIARARCTLECSYTPGLFGKLDRLRVEQVVTNLLSNALKYGAGTHVTVTTRLRGSLAELCVSDRGIGIAAVDQKRIFERFERAVSARNFAGLGLGLYIVRQLVEAMGGSVAVTSTTESARLTTFSVVLPTCTP